jgi:hypothetical protein
MVDHKNLVSRKASVINTFLFIFAIILQIKLANCGSGVCYDKTSLTSDTTCYVGKIIINYNSKEWRAGHASVFNTGDLIVEFSQDAGSNSRILWGLKIQQIDIISLVSLFIKKLLYLALLIREDMNQEIM